MKQLLEKILNIGVTKNLSSTEIKQIRLLNSFCLTWGGFIPLFIIADFIFYTNVWETVRVHLIAFIVLTLVLILQNLNKYLLAKLLYITSFIVLITMLTNSIQIGKNIEVVYYVVPLISLLLINNKWINLTYLALCFLLFYIPNLIWNYYETVFHNPTIILCVFIGSYITLNYSQTLNKKSEKKLAKAYLELEESKKNEYADLKLKSLRAQMNPHFMFNALNSIQDLILKQDIEASYDYIAMFAQLIRDTLNYSNQDFISIENELNFLKTYLELEKLRFGDLFNYTISYNEKKSSIEVPSLLIQPFVENALVHGLIHRTGEKELHIDFKLTKNILHCTITDNGIGRQKAESIIKRQGNHHKSFALEAIEKRLEVFYKKYYENVGYNIIDLYENENAIGTKVVLTMPYKMRF